MYNKNYLSKRPFLVVNTKFTPGPGARTAQKDWAEKSGWNVVEEVAIVDRVTSKHTTYATLIVDILEARCIKNGFGNASSDDAMHHFMQKYKEQITEAMGVWLEREAQKKAKLELITTEDAHKALTAQLVATGNVEVQQETAEEATAEPTAEPAAE